MRLSLLQNATIRRKPVLAITYLLSAIVAEISSNTSISDSIILVIINDISNRCTVYNVQVILKYVYLKKLEMFLVSL